MSGLSLLNGLRSGGHTQKGRDEAVNQLGYAFGKAFAAVHQNPTPQETCDAMNEALAIPTNAGNIGRHFLPLLGQAIADADIRTVQERSVRMHITLRHVHSGTPPMFHGLSSVIGGIVAFIIGIIAMANLTSAANVNPALHNFWLQAWLVLGTTVLIAAVIGVLAGGIRLAYRRRTVTEDIVV